MIFHKSELRIYEQYQIKLSDSVLLKLEDAAKSNKELLITIDASHFGMKNGNGVIYRHDTVKDNIQSFIYPNPKPMIERHKPKTSDKFGHIVSAEYKLTKFYDELGKDWELEGLSTSEYMDLCKDVLVPSQWKSKGYNGIAYVQVMGKLKHQDAIEKVIKREFLNVSIGADPKRLICSECYQDQTVKICDHYAEKGNGVFMLAEQLEYQELSFVPRGADPYGRVIEIHDELQLMDSYVDVLNYNDFYKITENKTIVCVDNICTICDQEEEMAKRKVAEKVVSVSYKDEFSAEKLKELKLADEQVTDEVIETLVLNDEEKDDQFALIQKTEDGLKRRFFIGNETGVKLAIQLIDQAEDLTEAELTKAKSMINKSAKKLGIECSCKDEKADETEVTTEGVTADVTAEEQEVVKDKTVESITDELIELLKAVDDTKLQDEDNKTKPISFVMNAITSLATNVKWAGEDLKSSVDEYLTSLGQEAVEKCASDKLKDSVQSLTDELEEAKSDIALLDEQNRELNYQIRVSLVDEIISHKDIEEDKVAEERTRLTKLSYDTLKEVASELRKTPTKSTSVVNNKQEKNFSTVKDPTLADEQGGELDESGSPKIADEQVEAPLTEKQLAEAIAAMFRKNF